MAQSKLPRYVVAIADRKGRTRFYFRFQKTYQRLPDDPASAEFHIRYGQLKSGIEREPQIGRDKVRAGSMAAMIRDYKASPEFTRLAARSQVAYTQQLDRLACLGAFQARDVGRAQILKLRDKIAIKGTRTADLFISITRRLFAFGIDRELVVNNPATRVARINDEESYAPWSAAQALVFEQSNPPQWMMTAYMLGRWTAQRRGDVLVMRREQFDGTRITLRQNKTGTELEITCHSALCRYLDALPIDVGLLVPGPRGRPWDESAFSKALRAHLDKIGLVDCHFHGLRHMHATALAEAGGTEDEIKSVTGHASSSMVRRYTKRARQKTLSASAALKLEPATPDKNGDGT